MRNLDVYLLSINGKGFLNIKALGGLTGENKSIDVSKY